MSKFKNSILTELGIKESSLPQSAVREDAFPGIDPQDQDDSMEQPTPREKMLSPTAVMPQVLAVSVKGSSTGGLPSGKSMSRGKLGGYEPISNAKENSLVVNNTPNSRVISNPAPIANDGGAESTPAEEHPHQTQTATDEPPQAVTGASTETDTSLTLKTAVPNGIDVDINEKKCTGQADCMCKKCSDPEFDPKTHSNSVAQSELDSDGDKVHFKGINEMKLKSSVPKMKEDCFCDEEKPEKVDENKGIPFEQLMSVRQSLQEKAQTGTMSKKESEVFACITEVLQKRGLGLEQKLFGKKTMLETAGVADIKKKLTENKFSTEELASMWEEDRQGEYVQIDDNGNANYIAHGTAMEQIKPQYGSIWSGIQAWMRANQFYPNIWHVNERGNLELMSRNGKLLGGIV